MVSVITPVYQAAEFIETAVLSAIDLEGVGEVILIEDGSKDNSLAICRKLQATYSKVTLLYHPNHANKGASASRNLGIQQAKFPFIAFLDADDYYLPNRFEAFLTKFQEGIEFDGMYAPIQYFGGSSKVYGIHQSIPAIQLLHYLIRGTYGHFHTNGLIVKKELLLQAGLFVETLDLHEDSDLWLKLAFYGSLIPGELNTPVAMVRKHEGNRIWTGTTNKTRFKQWKVTWDWAKNKPIGLVNKLLIIRKLLKYKLGSLKE